MYDEVLIERNLHPVNFCEKCDGKRLFNSSCGDELFVDLEISDEGVILDGKFSGRGCAISLVSADLMIDFLRGKTIEEARKLREEFNKMVVGEKHEDLGGMECLGCVARMPARVNCAKLPWKLF